MNSGRFNEESYNKSELVSGVVGAGRTLQE